MSFDDLTERDKIHLIRNNADFIFAIEHYNAIANLYMLNKTLVEIRFDSETKQVLKVRSLTLQDLDPYLNQIKLCF